MTCSRNLISPLLLAAFATGCSSMSDSVATLEARGGLVGESESYHEWPGGYSGSNGPGRAIEGGGNVAWRSYGLRSSLNTPEIDVICGVGRRSIEGQGITEASLGLRKRFFGSYADGPYIETALLHGFDLDTPSGRRDYEGMAFAIGLILPLSRTWFLDLGCSVEWSFDRLDLQGGNERLSDVLLNVGIGVVL